MQKKNASLKMFKNVGLHSMIDFNMQNMQNACEKNAQI